MEQAQITVANQTISLSWQGAGCTCGTLVRLNDGLEASFNGHDCLLHLIEGMVGRRAWQAQQAQIIATIQTICRCS